MKLRKGDVVMVVTDVSLPRWYPKQGELCVVDRVEKWFAHPVHIVNDSCHGSFDHNELYRIGRL
jgi:hypothetical protein